MKIFQPTITGSINMTGSFNLTGSITSNLLTVISGSSTELLVTGTGVTIGNIITDTHRITGSLSISGSITASSFLIPTSSAFQSNLPYVVYRLPAAVTFPSGSVVSGSIVNIPRSTVNVGQTIEVRMIASTPNTASTANRTVQTRYGGPGNQVQSLTIANAANQNGAFISFARVTSGGTSYARNTVGSNNQGFTTAADVGGNIVLEYLVDSNNQTLTIEHIAVTIY